MKTYSIRDDGWWAPSGWLVAQKVDLDSAVPHRLPPSPLLAPPLWFFDPPGLIPVVLAASILFHRCWPYKDSCWLARFKTCPKIDALWEHVSSADEDSVERQEIGFGAKIDAETWEAGTCQGGLQTMKNLSVFSSKLFFFILTSLRKAK